MALGVTAPSMGKLAAPYVITSIPGKCGISAQREKNHRRQNHYDHCHCSHDCSPSLVCGSHVPAFPRSAVFLMIGREIRCNKDAGKEVPVFQAFPAGEGRKKEIPCKGFLQEFRNNLHSPGH
jgi:hypothetical protein